jgi:hypothetical protein
MEELPDYIQDLAPFLCFGLTYIAPSLLVRLRDHIAASGSFQSFSKALLSLYKEKYMRYQLMYYSRWRHINTLEGAADDDCKAAPQFSSFGDPMGWAGSTPSAQVFRKIFLDDHGPQGRGKWLDKRLQLIDPGPILKGDASYKAAKLIYSEGRNVCGSIYTLMNGRNEVGAFVHAHCCCFKCRL